MAYQYCLPLPGPKKAVEQADPIPAGLVRTVAPEPYSRGLPPVQMTVPMLGLSYCHYRQYDPVVLVTVVPTTGLSLHHRQYDPAVTEHYSAYPMEKDSAAQKNLLASVPTGLALQQVAEMKGQR